MTTFLSTLLSLINQKGVTKNKLLTDLSLGKNSFVNWESRNTVPNGETVQKIADYFNVTTDYLLGNDTSSKDNPPSDDEIMFALFNGRDGITDEMYEEVKEFAQMVKLREEQKKKKKGE